MAADDEPGAGEARVYGGELTLAELLLRRTAATPDAPYAIFPEETATLAELRERALGFARGLLALGLRPGDHVAILMPNCLDFMVAHFGIQLAGGVGILLNARYRSHEIRHAVQHSDARFLVTTDRFDAAVNYSAILTATYPELATADRQVPLALADAPDLARVILFGRGEWAAAIPVAQMAEAGAGQSSADLDAARAAQQPDDTAVMIFTSGTTALPKACEITHAGLQRSWSIFSRTVDLKAGEKVWVPMPFFHSGGIGLMTGLMAAGAAIASAPHFNPDTVIDMVERHRIDILYPGFHLLGAPVLQSPRYDAGRFPFIRTAVMIGPLGTLKQLQALLPPGAPILSLFGMSEASGLLTLAARSDPENLRLSACGRPLPGVEIKIADPATGEPLPAETDGEILFRGGGVFKGYYKDPEATRRTIRPDGFVHTGDLGRVGADGTLTYVGRIKEMLRVGGENVAAAEVESFLSQHPDVLVVAVVGKDDERLGEVPIAFVELRDGGTSSADDIIAFCKGRVAGFKVPREVHFVTDWPMSATKIQKFKLKELLERQPVAG